jgi:hypothetical protein
MRERGTNPNRRHEEKHIMKNGMFRSIGATALCAALLLAVAMPAWAGQIRVGGQVTVANPQTASGGLRFARYSADPNQRIGCRLIMDDSYYSYYYGALVLCEARSNVNAAAACWSYFDKYREAVQSIGPASFISFVANGTTGQCTELQVDNSSQDNVFEHASYPNGANNAPVPVQ